MRIAMIGTGYVGLVSGACFADFGHEVVCVDRDADKIATLLNGEIPIYEPGLDQLVRLNVAAGRLRFTTVLSEAVEGAGAVFIAVGTPSRRGDGHADLRFVYAAAEDIARSVAPGTVVVTKSTVPVGTGDEVERVMRAAVPGLDVSVASNPEFLREGAAIEDFKRPDRIVIGVEDQRARDVMAEVYRPLHLNQGPLVFTSRRAAELIKYASNAFLAMKVTFINEMADLCEAVGADVQEVARGIGLDRRIGPKFLHAGPGYGGSCFPKDTLALVRTAEAVGVPSRLVETTVAVNDRRKAAMASRVIKACGGSVRGKTIAVLGLSFKPNTDDMREAPSLVVVPALQDAGAAIKAHDPAAMAGARPLLPGVELMADPFACLTGADALVILTEWDAYRGLDLARAKTLMRTPVLVDLRNVYRPEAARAVGFDYVGVGRA